MINVKQITSKLALMPDASLKQFAEMHKEDPYSFSLAIAESNRRKQIRSQVPPEEEQPKVADQEISGMSPMPEDVGIGALPFNMRMADGGIIGFANGGDFSNEGRSSKPNYESYARQKAAEMGVDPDLAHSIFTIESNYNPNAQSKTGPQGLGQLTKKTGIAYGVKAEDRFDPYKNMDASIAFMSDLTKKYKGDTSKILVGYNQGETVLNRNLRENKGELNVAALKEEPQNYLKKFQKLAFKLAPGSVAQAESLPVQTASAVDAQQPKVVDGYEVDQFGIPGRRADVPRVEAPEPVDERSIFEKGADYASIPKEFQRNFSNTLNALGGGFGGASRMKRGIESGAKALEEAVQATPEAIAAAAAAAQKIANTRIAKPVVQGIENLTQEAQALRAAAENSRLGRLLKGDTDAARAAQKSVDESNEAARVLRMQAEAADLAKAAQVNKVNKAVNATRLISGLNAVDAQMQRGNFATTDPRRTDTKQVEDLNISAAQSSIDDMPREMQSLENRFPLKKEDLTKEDKEEIIDLSKNNIPPGIKTKGFTDDDWLQFGLALMSGDSPYALQNIGKAGLVAVAGKKEREKEERAALSKLSDKTDMTKVIDRLMKEDKTLSYRDAYDIYSSGKTALEAKLRGIGVQQQSADTASNEKYQKAVSELDKSIIGFMARSSKATPAEKQAYFDALAKIPKPILSSGQQVAPVTTTAPAALPLKVLNNQ